MKTISIKTFLYASIVSLFMTSCFKEDVNEALGTNNSEISIYALRNLYKGQKITLESDALTDAKYIRALVVSNHEGNNFPSNYIAVQNEWRSQLRGIMVEVDDPERYKFGDSVDIWVDGLQLLEKDGVLTLSGLTHNNTYIINRNNPVSARPVSIATLNAQYANYEATYVEVTSDLEVEPASGETIKGSKAIADAEENRVYITVVDNATFANETVAPSATFRGVALRDNEKIQLRLLTYADMAFPSGKIDLHPLIN